MFQHLLPLARGWYAVALSNRQTEWAGQAPSGQQWHRGRSGNAQLLARDRHMGQMLYSFLANGSEAAIQHDAERLASEIGEYVEYHPVALLL